MKAFLKISRARRSGSSAFSLIEIMVVMALMSVIILGLMAMFTQTQRAFKLGMTQTDVLESGRIATGLITRELEQITPNYVGRVGVYNAPNFYSAFADYGLQDLPTAGTAVARSNILQDLYFVTRENQTWLGVGYFVRSNPTNSTLAPVASLYRFQMPNNVAQFEQHPNTLFSNFYNAVSGLNPAMMGTTNVSKILDGVVSFRVRAYDTNGVWIAPPSPIATAPYPYWFRTNILVSPGIARAPIMADTGMCTFYSNAVPAFVELEIGILEQKTLEIYKTIPIFTNSRSFCENRPLTCTCFGSGSRCRT